MQTLSVVSGHEGTVGVGGVGFDQQPAPVTQLLQRAGGAVTIRLTTFSQQVTPILVHTYWCILVCTNVDSPLRLGPVWLPTGCIGVLEACAVAGTALGDQVAAAGYEVRQVHQRYQYAYHRLCV